MGNRAQARLLSLFGQRVAMATAQAAREGRVAHDAIQAAQTLRRNVSAGLAVLGLQAETELSREALQGRLRGLAVQRAHFAETALEAADKESRAEDARQRQAEATARGAEARRKEKKVQRWLDLSRRRGRVVDAAREFIDVEEVAACRHP